MVQAEPRPSALQLRRLLQVYASALRADPSDLVLRTKLAEVLRLLRRDDEAIALYSSVAWAHGVAGNLGQAIMICKLILELNPSHSATQEMLAKLYASKQIREQKQSVPVVNVGGRWVADPRHARPGSSEISSVGARSGSRSQAKETSSPGVDLDSEPAWHLPSVSSISQAGHDREHSTSMPGMATPPELEAQASRLVEEAAAVRRAAMARASGGPDEPRREQLPADREESKPDEITACEVPAGSRRRRGRDEGELEELREGFRKLEASQKEARAATEDRRNEAETAAGRVPSYSAILPRPEDLPDYARERTQIEDMPLEPGVPPPYVMIVTEDAAERSVRGVAEKNAARTPAQRPPATGPVRPSAQPPGATTGPVRPPAQPPGATTGPIRPQPAATTGPVRPAPAVEPPGPAGRLAARVAAPQQPSDDLAVTRNEPPRPRDLAVARSGSLEAPAAVEATPLDPGFPASLEAGAEILEEQPEPPPLPSDRDDLLVSDGGAASADAGNSLRHLILSPLPALASDVGEELSRPGVPPGPQAATRKDAPPPTVVPVGPLDPTALARVEAIAGDQSRPTVRVDAVPPDQLPPSLRAPRTTQHGFTVEQAGESGGLRPGPSQALRQRSTAERSTQPFTGVRRETGPQPAGEPPAPPPPPAPVATGPQRPTERMDSALVNSLLRMDSEQVSQSAPGPGYASIQREVVDAGLAEQDSGEMAADEADQVERNLLDTLRETPGAVPVPADSVERFIVPFPLFSDLDTPAFLAVIRRLDRRVLKPGEWVFREGDPGDSLYLVSSGILEVVKESDRSGPIQLARLGGGSFFGEFGLLTDGRRHAAVRCEEECELLELRRDVIVQLCEEHPSITWTLRTFYQQRVMSTVLATSPIFQAVSPTDRKSVISRFTFRRFMPDEIIIAEERQGTGFFVILVGSARVSCRAEDGSEVELGVLSEGNYFGEMSLLSGFGAEATVRAGTVTEVLVLNPQDFYELTAEHPEIWAVVQSEAERRREDTARRLASIRPSAAGSVCLI